MDVYTTDPLTDPRWAQLQREHPRASIFHTWGWLEALRRTYGYEPLAFTTSPPGSKLTDSLLFCQIRTWLTGRRLVSLPFSDHCNLLVNDPGALECLLAFLKQDSLRKHCRSIEMRPVESPAIRLTDFSPAKTFSFHTLDLSPTIDDLFRALHKDCIQRKIKRSEREALRYEQGRSESLLDKFYYLLLLTRRRQGLPSQPVQWFRNLISCLGAALTIRIASKGQRPIAGILTLQYKRTMVYKYGCSDQRFNNLGGTQLVFWKAIQEAKKDELSEFDMGRSDNDNSSLVTFKERWGAIGSPLTYWQYPACPVTDRSQEWTVRVAKQVLTHAPNTVVSTVGKLLYRHIG